MRTITCLTALAAATLSLGAAERPNIVLILSDDHSYPYLHCYGIDELRTPTLDRLAAEGCKFRRMFVDAPQCVPSRATIMTGRSPVACRITRFSSPLPADEITFPEILKRDAGYFVGVLGRTYHLDGSDRGPEISNRVMTEYHLKTFAQRFDSVDVSNQDHIPAAMEDCAGSLTRSVVPCDGSTTMAPMLEVSSDWSLTRPPPM